MDANDPTRKRGVLNQREREWLQGERDDIEPQSPDERAIRGAIRNHLENALLDFQLVFENLPERDMNRVFGKADDRTERQERERALRPALHGLLGFIYAATDGTRLDFKKLVGMGVFTGGQRFFGREDRADVEIEEGVSVHIDDVADALETGDVGALTDIERLWVLETLTDSGALPDVREVWEQTDDGQMVRDLQDDLRELDNGN